MPAGSTVCEAPGIRSVPSDASEWYEPPAVPGTRKSLRSSSTAVFAVGFLVIFELLARVATRPSALLWLHIESYPTAFAHRENLARQTHNAPVVVLGDSTATRGLNACSLGRALGTSQGVNFSFPSGGMREADALLKTQTPPADGTGRAIYAVNPLNISTYSEWVTPTFADLTRRSGVVPAVIGTVSTLYGHREATVAVLASLVNPWRLQKQKEAMAREGICGREPNGDPKIPSATEQAEQVLKFGKAWLQLFTEATSTNAADEISERISEWKRAGWAATVVLMPLRDDFRDYLDREWPGLRDRKRTFWRTITARAGVAYIECDEAIADRSLYEDPVHLNEYGRRKFTECFADELNAKPTCCRPRGP